MNLLLPHRYKKVGAVMAPLGLALWLVMQAGILKRLLVYMFDEPIKYAGSAPHIVNIVAAVLGFFGFLGGIYLVSFSRELVEDEMVQRTRLDSFQFAAVLQILVIIVGFFCMFVFGDPGQGGMMLFFVCLVAIFWLSFIFRFNYILHVKYRQ